MIGHAASPTMLVVDASPETWAMALEEGKLRGISVITAPDPQVALAMIDMAAPDILMTDLFPADQAGVLLIRELRMRSPKTAILATGESGDAETILNVVRAGAGDYLQKPVLVEELGLALDRALRQLPSTVENIAGVEHGDHAGRGAHFGEIDRSDRRMRALAQAEIEMREAGGLRQIVDIERFARDMLVRGIMCDALTHAACDRLRGHVGAVPRLRDRVSHGPQLPRSHPRATRPRRQALRAG